MRVLICGDRNYTNRKKIRAYMVTLPKNTIIIDGGARGADSLANEIAVQNGYPTERYFAEWNIYGRAAGPIRNKQMLDEGKPDLVVYFHDDIDNSKGTRNMILKATAAGIPVKKGS